MRINLSGIVAADDDLEIYDWYGIKAFSPQTVRQALADNPEGEDMVLEINSPGGSVWAGGEIYSVLRAAQSVVTRAEIQSLAASAASYLCLGCDEVWISPVAQMMIHLPTTFTDGDRLEHLKNVQMLDSTREAILNAYELKSQGKTNRAGLRRMMSQERWFTAQEAVDLGLADGVLYQEAAVPQDVMNAAGAGFRALGGGGVPDIALLRTEYRKAKGTVNDLYPEDVNWRARARLELEKLRFLKEEYP